jgi:dolichol-phosphate mannosyltransferase
MQSIIIPAKNEPYLPTLINQLNTIGNYQILIQTEPGLSNAVLKVIFKAQGQAIAVIDADGSHPPENLPSMFYLAQYYDIVIGSRYTKMGTTNDVAMRQLISKVYCLLTKILFKLSVDDPLSGFIVAKQEALTGTPLNSMGYKWALELLIKTNGKLKVTEYPINFQKRQSGVSKAGFGQGIKTLAFILKLWVEQQCN